jgi:hypothetical protein
MKALAVGIKAFLSFLVRHAASAQTWFMLLGIGGAALVLSGVFMLAGFAWALIGAGSIAIATAILIMIGMTRA